MEEAFLQALRDDPADDTTWLVLADWLEEAGDPRGELMRVLFDLRRDCADREAREERLRRLLQQGVRPCLPRLTNSIRMELTLIPPGTFVMGSPETEPDSGANEWPQRLVTIGRPFYLGVVPVTQLQYQAVMRTNPAHFFSQPLGTGGPDYPVEQVSWVDALRFCERLSALPAEQSAGRVYRLPTEAEWEYACRAGTTTPFWFGTSAGSGEANFDGDAPYGSARRDSYREQTTPVGFFPSNAFGLHDTHGNVWEWCRDWYDEYAYTHAAHRDPQGPSEGEERVVRGGAWCSDGWECRSASRGRMPPQARDNDVGFRVAMS
jgi:uncharacterized protein (TIGR02996 family)